MKYRCCNQIPWIIVLAVILALRLMPSICSAQNIPEQGTISKPPPPAPPTEITVIDHKNDDGKSIDISWQLSADDGAGKFSVLRYEVLRAESPQGPFEVIGEVTTGTNQFTDTDHSKEPLSDAEKQEGVTKTVLENHVDYFYKIVVWSTGNVFSESITAGPVRASAQWFHTGKTTIFVFSMIFFITTFWVIGRAKRGARLYIRPIGGIAAVDDAIGRATEMGRPILYLLGLGVADEAATLASYTILARVARRVAEYQTKVIVPCWDATVMVIAQEVVKSAYLQAGYPDSFDEDDVFFVTMDQFSYTAAVNGLMLRERPAANFYLGRFYAESLILAETGFLAGSIQIAGTDEIIQIPFFIAACDFTLIGEELYAASAYLSRDPPLLGALKSQDYGKAMVAVFIIIAVILASLGYEWVLAIFNYID